MPERKQTETQSVSSRDLAIAAARAAADKQGERVVVLDVRELIVITDYFVIASKPATSAAVSNASIRSSLIGQEPL